MARKKACKVCGYENSFNTSCCGMCGADFSIESNYEEINSGGNERPVHNDHNPQSSNSDSTVVDDSADELKEVKRLWGVGFSKFLSVAIVLIFAIGLLVFGFGDADKLYNYKMFYESMVDDNNGNVIKTIKEVSSMNSKELEEAAKQYENQKRLEQVNNINNSVNNKESNTTQNNSNKSKKNSSYIFKNSNKRYLKDKELKKLSKKKLGIARNEIYARAGRKFTDSKWKKYFKKKTWYKPKYSAKYFDKHEKKLLNKYERANIKKIKKYEKKRG